MDNLTDEEKLPIIVKAYESFEKKIDEYANQLGTVQSKIYGIEKSIESLWEGVEQITEKLNSGNYEPVVDYTPILTRLVDALHGINFQTPSGPEPVKRKPEDFTLDISKIKWKIAGGGEARDSDPFAWAFIYKYGTKEVLPSVKEVYDLIEEYGTLTVGKYEITLGGNNKTLLNRTVPK